MPTIVLSEPFIRHFAGSVFTVSDAIGVSGWDDDDRVREKQSCYDQRVYYLPDDGKGAPAELPLPSTFDCPENILSSVDVKSGPCRITSVSKSLGKAIDDPYYVSPLPLGKGKILYQDSEKYVKNTLYFDLNSEEKPDTALVKNKVSEVLTNIIINADVPPILNFDNYEAGFYEISLLRSNFVIHHFTMIKCFPLVVSQTDVRSKYRISQTIW
ncbi:MAG: hypothetical protein IPL55_13330 [Saprospiraceae bacterium]|jgi:hypothetical protein|nr:hypothetical protein [Saprospiraceae bacterium]MBL0024374.1 hypothetical protein [Saprospiraceae bacterium]